MNEREKQLLEQDILTNDEVNELMEQFDYERCGESGRHPNHELYVFTVEGTEYEICVPYGRE